MVERYFLKEMSGQEYLLKIRNEGEVQLVENGVGYTVRRCYFKDEEIEIDFKWLKTGNHFVETGEECHILLTKNGKTEEYEIEGLKRGNKIENLFFDHLDFNSRFFNVGSVHSFRYLGKDPVIECLCYINLHESLDDKFLLTVRFENEQEAQNFQPDEWLGAELEGNDLFERFVKETPSSLKVGKTSKSLFEKVRKMARQKPKKSEIVEPDAFFRYKLFNEEKESFISGDQGRIEIDYADWLVAKFHQTENPTEKQIHSFCLAVVEKLREHGVKSKGCYLYQEDEDTLEVESVPKGLTCKLLATAISEVIEDLTVEVN